MLYFKLTSYRRARGSTGHSSKQVTIEPKGESPLAPVWKGPHFSGSFQRHIVRHLLHISVQCLPITLLYFRKVELWGYPSICICIKVSPCKLLDVMPVPILLKLTFDFLKLTARERYWAFSSERKCGPRLVKFSKTSTQAYCAFRT